MYKYMNSINTETEIIFSIEEKDFPKFKSFLESLKLSGENSEILDFWFDEGAWNIESDEGERFIVIFGKSMIHIIIRKDDNFEKLRDKLLKFISF